MAGKGINLATNTKYSPEIENQYSSKALSANFRGFSFIANQSAITTFDFENTDDCLLNGAMLFVNGGEFGDKISAQVFDKNNVMGYGANIVLNQFITDWCIAPFENKQFDIQSIYPAKIYAGLFIRAIYSSVGTSSPKVVVNLKLHKVLW